MSWIVLLAEDSYDDQKVLSRIFQHHGITTYIAVNGSECLDLLEKIEPTCIIVDLALPVRDGWETLEAIRANERTARLPVIAVTGYHSANLAEDARKAGFDGYFPKPLHPLMFIEQLEKIVMA